MITTARELGQYLQGFAVYELEVHKTLLVTTVKFSAYGIGVLIVTGRDETEALARLIAEVNARREN